MRTFFHRGALVGLFCLCVSCGDSPELVEKDQQLDADIAKLNKQLLELEKQKGPGPDDLGEEYARVEAELTAARNEATRVSGQLAEMRDEKTSLENRFEKYRQDFPIN